MLRQALKSRWGLSIPVRVTIQQIRKSRIIVVSEFLFYLKKEFVRCSNFLGHMQKAPSDTLSDGVSYLAVYAYLPICRHSDTGDDYYVIYRHVKHIRQYYQVIDSGNSIPTHPLEYRLRSIETAS